MEINDNLLKSFFINECTPERVAHDDYIQDSISDDSPIFYRKDVAIIGSERLSHMVAQSDYEQLGAAINKQVSTPILDAVSDTQLINSVIPRRFDRPSEINEFSYAMLETAKFVDSVERQNAQLAKENNKEPNNND